MRRQLARLARSVSQFHATLFPRLRAWKEGVLDLMDSARERFVRITLGNAPVPGVDLDGGGHVARYRRAAGCLSLQ